jgi:penicillin G amidase
MNKLNPIIKNIFGIIFLLLAVVITLVILFNSLTKKSAYQESGNIKIKGIKDSVAIYRDGYGVPHIVAQNESDLYFSLGYSHAHDRLWQMDLYRRIAEGKISEILGKDALEYDKMFRTIGIDKISIEFYKSLSGKSKSILESYCKGVNSFILSHNKNLPLEFDILNYKPEVWKPEHSLMLVRLVGWELNLSWYTDFMFGEIIKKYGLEKAKDFFPNYPEDAPFIVKSEKKLSDKNIKSDTTKKISELKISDNYVRLAELGKTFFNTNIGYRNYFGIAGTHIGSNAWVVSGKKSENGKPILANDPHLALQVPDKWFEVNLLDKSTNINVSGFSIPGVPCLAIGRNNYISWGITNLMNDDADFYILKRDSLNNDKYIYKNISYSLDSITESIKIKDVKDEYFFTVYKTKLGPVVSNLEKTGLITNQKFYSQPNEILTFKWTGFDFSDEIHCFYELNNAKNWNEFKNAIKDFNLPASNFIYADISGNIGYHAAGKVPIRKNLTNEFSALYPSNGEIEWSGYINFDELPQAFNPKEEYIVTANNKPVKDYKFYISNLYEPRYRAERIENILKQRNNFNANEFKLIQNDVYNLQGKEFCNYLFDAYKDSLSINQEEKYYLELLKKWDYEMKPYSTAATLFSEFEIQLYKNIYKDKFGDELFENYLFLKNIPVRNTEKLLKETGSWMFDIYGTGNKTENKNDILRKSFRDAIDNLKDRFHTSDYNNWIWGEVHKVTIKHPLGIVQALGPLLNIGPYEIGGSGTTIANAEYNLYYALTKNNFDVILGASMRFIADMSDTKSYYSVLPTGESGQPQNENYKDQTRLWINGEYKKVITDISELKKENVKILVLIPEK